MGIQKNILLNIGSQFQKASFLSILTQAYVSDLASTLMGRASQVSPARASRPLGASVCVCHFLVL